ncbi:MAG: MBL fold metallo-hydrolase [Anaerolineae bacterium]
MPNYICTTCGAQFPDTPDAPDGCPICLDDRQYVNPAGQQWTTPLAMAETGYANSFRPLEPNLSGIGIEPKFAIGQRALLVQTPRGNILWDCVPYLEEDVTVPVIERLGGIDAIAISHPHFYTGMAEWSRAFGNVPIYLHESNREWVMRPTTAIEYWSGDHFSPWDGITLVRCGGHFPGSTVLHWPAGAGGRGVLLTGDTIYVVADRRFASFMYSYPNLVPLSAAAVQGIWQAVQPFEFDRLYAGWADAVMQNDAKALVQRSVERYLRHISP